MENVLTSAPEAVSVAKSSTANRRIELLYNGTHANSDGGCGGDRPLRACLSGGRAATREPCRRSLRGLDGRGADDDGLLTSTSCLKAEYSRASSAASYPPSSPASAAPGLPVAGSPVAR